MNMLLTDEQIAFQKDFKEFVEREVFPIADQQDQNECLDEHIVEKLANKGYLGAVINPCYGGKGWDPIVSGVMHEEFGRASTGLRSLFTVHEMVAIAIQRWGSEEQKEKWLPKMAKGEVIGAFALTEPEVGSDAKSIQAVAEHKENCFVINGQKRWITMGQIADIFLVFAKYDDKPTAFIVESNRDGFTRKPIKGMMGFRASMGAELFFENCEIPEENMVGRCGAGLTHVALSCLDHGRYTVACGCVGLGQACLEESTHYARQRKQFGERLINNQLIKKMITEMAVQVKAARQLCYYAGYLKVQKHPDSINETWVAKYFASTMLDKICSDAVQIHGANGCNQLSRVERLFRDAKINSIIEGSSQMHELLIATNTAMTTRRAKCKQKAEEK